MHTCWTTSGEQRARTSGSNKRAMKVSVEQQASLPTTTDRQNGW